MHDLRPRPTLLATVLLSLLITGCGVYSTRSGRIDQSIRRVAVPYLENRSNEPDIEIELTEAIIASLQDDNTLKVVDLDDAQSELSGAVIGYRRRPVFTTSELQVDEYQVQIAVQLTFRNLATGEALFERKRFTGTGNFILDDPNGTTEQTAREEAAAQIVRDIVAAVVEDW